MGTRKHVLQSDAWGEAKTKIGTPAVQAGGVQFTKHKIPATAFFYGYAPKINPFEIDWRELSKKAAENNCVVINFDCPNVPRNDPEAGAAEKVLSEKCSKSPRNTFAGANVILDISPPEDELLAGMHPKTRYNVRYAEKSGIFVREGLEGDLKTFTKFQRETARRQNFFVHNDSYYETVWETLRKYGMAKLLVAEFKGRPVSAWLFLVYEKTLYYPYGGWNKEHQNLFPNNLLCWEGIKMGKRAGCETFDMWGA
ncbi:peptidoglycan bridge formation glycyltransferase FemA/FemB family protein, partial [candidate division WWE3 bacterium]|nr:peptidoglycan bridge formation glycyltransferase FemA/FemB family protein [candidate division WWE3 bacterium]